MPEDFVEGESDLRKRAAWLLAMLVLAAILIVVVMTTLLHSDKGGGGNANDNPPVNDPLTSSAPPTTPSRTHGSTSPTGAGGSSTSGSTSPTAPGSSTSVAAGPTSCPTTAPCALPGDAGNALAAINAYRTQQHLPTVPGAVSDAAKKCALSRGDGCTGGWAETEIPAPADGQVAVQKILQFAKLTDPKLKSIEIGWAYNPGSKTYYFVTIRQDT